MNNFSLEHFQNDVKDHVLTVNLDQGLYRDITIGKPGTGDMRYHITTRPGYLMFTGDMGSFTFSRLGDMFNFFRGDKVNLSYWHEKLEAVDSRGGSKGFSIDAVKECLHDQLNEHLAGIDTGNYDSDEDLAHKAKEAIQSLIDKADDSEHEFYEELKNWEPSENGGVEMDYWWEWDFKDFTSRYIWCCHAIVRAIKMYDESNEVVA